MPLSYKKRLEIVFLSLHPKGPHMGNATISRWIKCHINTVKFWVNRYKRTGDVLDLPKKSRSRATTLKQDDMIVKVAENEPKITLRKI